MASIAVKVLRFLDCARGGGTSTAELCHGVQEGRAANTLRGKEYVSTYRLS